MYHDRQLKPARPALSATSSRQYGTTHAFSLEFISCQNNSPARKFKTFFPIYVHIISSHVYVFNGLPRTVVFEVKKFFASSNLLQQIIGIQLIPTFSVRFASRLHIHVSYSRLFSSSISLLFPFFLLSFLLKFWSFAPDREHSGEERTIVTLMEGLIAAINIFQPSISLISSTRAI